MFRRGFFCLFVYDFLVSRTILNSALSIMLSVMVICLIAVLIAVSFALQGKFARGAAADHRCCRASTVG